MAMRRLKVDFHHLGPNVLEAWRAFSTTTISDALNRSQCMAAAIKPLTPDLRICGQARTVIPMPGDNSMVHVACSVAEPGEIVVVAGTGFEDIAMCGEVVVHCAVKRGLGGMVVDGSIRDSEEIARTGFPIFCRGLVPRGPHKLFGGLLDGAAAVGGVSVKPGDLIVGDRDGVVVVPLELLEVTYKDCLMILDRERRWEDGIAQGRTLMDVLRIPDPDWVMLPPNGD